MKLLVAITGIIFLASTASAGEKMVLKTQRDKVSYGIGMDIGNSLKKQSIDVDPDILSKGIKDMLSGKKPLMTEEEFRETMTNLNNEMMAKQMEQLKERGEKNRKKGEEFLAENKKKEGVVTLPSGLQYKVIKEGAGEKPKATDTVSVHYRGTLTDGTEFDSSYGSGQPVTLKVNGVIPGWTEALQLMNPGSKWQLFIPSGLAYGERGAGRGEIGPNETLIFEVELLSIKEGEAK
ncbi:MAG: FKBP-type peptidyl-prolyl cis-trans isomerase [Nitrospiraceae bacterium]|nr:MAG: FKBP-type peptidyl-prolyl cis-trans isomerase [Nitrospiraceae bacterium]